MGAAVRASGLSHRRFEQLFEQSAGLKPKTWQRVRRFQRAVHALAAHDAPAPAELAATLGYSDQSHLIREFRAMAGLTPGRFHALAPEEPNHLPLVPPRLR